MKRIWTIAAFAVCAAAMFVATLAGAQQAGSRRSITLPDIRIDLAEGEGKAKVATHCAICHSVDYVPMQPRLSREQWKGTVNKMISVYGAPTPPADVETIVNYLAAAYGTGS